MKKRNIITFIICLLISLATCSYGTSVSKYFSSEDEVAYYSLGFKRIVSGDILQQVRNTQSYRNKALGSGPEKLVYTFEIPRANYWESTDTDETYTLQLSNDNNKCSYKLETNKTGIVGNGQSTSFTTAYEEGDYIRAIVTCDIVYRQTFTFHYDLYEQFNASTLNPESNFKYFGDTAGILLNYFNEYSKDTYCENSNECVIKKNASNVDVKATLLDWINDYVYPDDEVLHTITNNYLLNYNISDINSLVGKTVPGLSISSDSTSYTITKQSNLSNYMMTYDKSGPLRSKKSFYFIGIVRTDPNHFDEFDNLFYEYLATYMYPVGSTEYIAVKNYMDDKIATVADINSVYDVINSGLVSALSYNSGIVTVKSNLYMFIKSLTISDCDEVEVFELFDRSEISSLAGFRRTLRDSGLPISFVYSKISSGSSFDSNITFATGGNTVINNTRHFYYFDSSDNHFIVKAYKTENSDTYLKLSYYALIKGEQLVLNYNASDYANSAAMYTDILSNLTSITGLYGETVLNDISGASAVAITTLTDGLYTTNIGSVYIETVDGVTTVTVQLAPDAPVSGASVIEDEEDEEDESSSPSQEDEQLGEGSTDNSSNEESDSSVNAEGFSEEVYGASNYFENSENFFEEKE